MPKRGGAPGYGPASKCVKTNVTAVWASKTFDQAKTLSIYLDGDFLNITRITHELSLFKDPNQPILWLLGQFKFS